MDWDLFFDDLVAISIWAVLGPLGLVLRLWTGAALLVLS